MKNKSNALFLTLIGALVLIASYLGYESYNQYKDNKMKDQMLSDNDKLLKDMELQMSQSGITDLMKGDVKSSLESLLSEYNEISTSNIELNDSINNQKDKINSLLSSLRSSEKNRKYTARELYKLKQETETIKNALRMYVNKVDSLNTLNQELIAEIDVKDKTIDKINSEKEQLSKKGDELNEKVKKGSQLNIFGLKAEGLRVKNSGSYEQTTKSRRADQIRACFTINKNSITQAGDKKIFMEVIMPNGSNMTGNGSGTIDIDGKLVKYSEMRSINYQNENMDVCIFLDPSQEFVEGIYKVNIYSSDKMLSSTSFSLK